MDSNAAVGLERRLNDIIDSELVKNTENMDVALVSGCVDDLLLFEPSRKYRIDDEKRIENITGVIRKVRGNGYIRITRAARAMLIAAVILAVLIGISRLYLGMHYPSDVVCGLLIGMIVATVVYRIILRAEDKRGMMNTWLSKENKKEK